MSRPLRTVGGIEIIGHRGYARRFPENTLPSLLGALAAGARSLEWDIHFTACGTPVLLHDATLDRTTDGSGAIAETPLAALPDLDAGAWFSPTFRGTPIPTLSAALGTVLRPARGLPARRLYVELKGVRPGHVSADLETLLETLVRLGAFERTVVISMDFHLLEILRKKAPHVMLGWVAADEASLEEGAAAVRRDRHALLDPDQQLLRADPGRTAAWIEAGIPLVTWTVNEESHARELLALGVRRLTTDDPANLLARFGPAGVRGQSG